MATLPDYSINVAQPFTEALKGYQLGMTTEVGRQELQQKQLEAQQALEQKKNIQTAFQKIKGPGATAADYANLSMMLPKDQAESVRKSFEMLDTDKQKTALSQTGSVFSALQAGKPEIAIALMDQQIEAKRNSGDETGAKFLETWRNVTKEDPKATQDFFGFTISQIPGGDKIITSAIALGGERRAQELQPSVKSEAASKAEKAAIEANFAERLAVAGLNKSNWDVKNVQSQINDRSKRFNLDSQVTAATVAEKLSSITKNINDIPADTRKLINESAVTAATSKQSADQFNNLAKRLEEAGGGFGAATSFADYMRKNTGSQSPLTELRQEYTRIRNSAAIKSLPPGVATDKDIELALKGIPPENADAGTMARFLRGMAKLQDIDSSVANAKTDWLAQNNGTLTRAKSTFIAGDFAAKPGESFNDLSQRIVTDVGKKYRSPEQTAEEKRQADFAKIPTNQTPAPAAAPVNVRSQADAILRGGK
jgi:hypothetical protein